MFNGVEVASDGVACLAATAERLRAVRAAHGRFLAMWAADHLLGDPAAADRFAADLDVTAEPDDASDNSVAIGDMKRALFRHGRLDD